MPDPTPTPPAGEAEQPLTDEEIESLRLVWDGGMGKDWHPGSYHNCIRRLLAALQAVTREKSGIEAVLADTREKLNADLDRAEAISYALSHHAAPPSSSEAGATPTTEGEGTA